MKDLKDMKEGNPFRDGFHRLALSTSGAAGSFWAFALALALIVLWGGLGPVFRYSDTWQLVINTGTTIITFLMIFLVQNTQNRDARAIHLKLDELIRHVQGARNSLIALEDMSDEELDKLEREFRRLRKLTGRQRRGAATAS
ncbi:MAG TPA: low affinity iron permease family protein [Candidatus Polarisedimenticolaceae bacterium]|nr:low affinity iron permease family protein [Candidatus Polarisedimenticolaceae bacterium]